MSSTLPEGDYSTRQADVRVPDPPHIAAHGSRILITAEEGATIYYTADGKDPSPASPEFPLHSTVDMGIGQYTIKAIAVRLGAASSTAVFHHTFTPQAIAMSPDNGDFEGSVTITVISEHKCVRYDANGFVPTASSPLYESPIVLSTAGKHVVTAAMFDGPRLVGDPVRKSYVVRRQRAAAPKAEPASGSYECPLRVTLTSVAGDIYYSLDGTEPSDASTVYTGPILATVPGDIELRAIAVDGDSSSVTIQERYNIRPRVRDEGFVADREEAALPTANVEFSNLSEMTAKAKAEEVMAWVMAAAEVKERRLAEATQLERELFDYRDEYRSLTLKLESVRKELSLANLHRRQLEEQQVSRKNVIEEDVERQLAELEDDWRSASLQERSVDAQLQEAVELHRQALDERSQLQQAAAEQREALEAAFLSQKRELATFGPDILTEVEELEMVVAEQRHELQLLRSTYDALRKRTEPESPEGPFLPTKKQVDLPSVETLLPIPAGALRKITTVQGTGLQDLRTKYYVDACVVSVGSGLGIRVVGHSAGVHGFVEEVDSILGS